MFFFVRFSSFLFSISVSNFIDFDGGIATVIANPQAGEGNTSETVAQIVRNGGQIWSGSKIELAENYLCHGGLSYALLAGYGIDYGLGKLKNRNLE